jgi:hypothetical protein
MISSLPLIMEQATPPDSGKSDVQQTTAALLEEIASLRKQNEEQQHELEQLRGAMPLSLRRSNNSLQPSTMARFTHFPLEIRETIWEQALPSRLLGCEDLRQKHVVPTDLFVPAMAHVCRESRSFAASKNHINALPGEFSLLEDETPSSRVKDATPACWNWFSPCNDALLINPRGFGGKLYPDNRFLARVAEHIIVEDPLFWRRFRESSYGLNPTIFSEQSTNVLLSQFTDWVRHVYVTPYFDNENSACTRGSICSLRTVDFAMREVTKVDRNCPPSFLHGLFGEDDFRVVDLSDKKPALEIVRLLGYELFEGIDPDDFFKWSTELADSLDIYHSVADELFQHLEPSMLKALVSSCFEASKVEDSGVHGTLPTPFMPEGFELDMEVAWVKELSKRLSVRPVHVFVLAGGV